MTIYSHGRSVSRTVTVPGFVRRYVAYDQMLGFRQAPIVPGVVLPYKRGLLRPLGFSAEDSGTGSGVPTHPFGNRTRNVLQRFVESTDIADGLKIEDLELGQAVVYARNKAYASLVQQVKGDSAEFLTAVLESQKAADMILTGIVRLAVAWTALRKGQFKRFLRYLGLRRKRKHVGLVRNRAADAGSLWLEYWMGWAPTANDLVTGLKILNGSQLPDSVPFRARGSYTLGAKNFEFRDTAYDWWRDSRESASVKVLYTGRSVLVNPNLALLAKLGLVNPITSVVQIMPWSWMVNWFVNLEQVLNAYSDLYGYEMYDTTSTAFVRIQHVAEGHFKPTLLPARRSWHARYEGIGVRRDLGIPKPKLAWNFHSRLSITRAATALSLLVQSFRR